MPQKIETLTQSFLTGSNIQDDQQNASARVSKLQLQRPGGGEWSREPPAAGYEDTARKNERACRRAVPS